MNEKWTKMECMKLGLNLINYRLLPARIQFCKTKDVYRSKLLLQAINSLQLTKMLSISWRSMTPDSAIGRWKTWIQKEFLCLISIVSINKKKQGKEKTKGHTFITIFISII